MKGVVPLTAAIAPIFVAEILMDADRARIGLAACKIRQNHRDMTNLGYDRVRLVGIALAIAAGVDVDVGYDLETRGPAMRPKRAKAAAVDDDDAGRQRIGIEIVIEDEFLNHTPPAVPAEQERACLALSVCAPMQLSDARLPDVGLADELRRRPEGDARER